MQLHHIDTQQLANTLEQSEVLAQLEGPGSTVYVLHYKERDILIHHANGADGSTMIYQDESRLPEGGSLHDQARAARREICVTYAR